MIHKSLSIRIPYHTARFFVRKVNPNVIYSNIHTEETILHKLNPDLIPDTKIDYGNLPVYEHKVNYNLEEFPGYAKKVKQAKEKRNL